MYGLYAEGATVSLPSRELRLVTLLNGGGQSAAVSALTTIAAEYVEVNATANVEASINDANARVAQAYNIKMFVHIRSVRLVFIFPSGLVPIIIYLFLLCT